MPPFCFGEGLIVFSKFISSIGGSTFLGGLRDRVLTGVLIAALISVLGMPVFTSFSLRDVTGVALTYALSLASALGVLIVLLVGGNLLSREMQNRTIYSVATLPISRSRYLVEKFLGFALLLFAAVAVLGVFNALGVHLLATLNPPDRPISWLNYFLCLVYDFEKLMVLASVLLFFSSFATSTLLPILLTLAVFVLGISTEKVKFFIETVKGAEQVSPFIRGVSKVIYYVFPNLSLFDLKTQAVYALPLDPRMLALTTLYGIGYVMVMLVLACAVFEKRNFT